LAPSAVDKPRAALGQSKATRKAAAPEAEAMKRRIGTRNYSGAKNWERVLGCRVVGRSLLCCIAPSVVTTALPVVTACSLAVDPGSKQCVVDADCQARGKDFRESICVENVCTYECTKSKDCTSRGEEFWNTECVAHVCVASAEWGCIVPDKPAPEGPTTTTEAHTLALQMADMLSQVPVSEVTARLCLLRDLDCASPVGKSVVSDATGLLALKVPAAFDGYVELLAQDRVPGLYFPPPLTADRTDPPVALAKVKDLAPFGDLFGGFIENRGTVMVSVFNCSGLPAQSVSFQSEAADKLSSPWYSENNLPIGTQATDTTGFGGFFNMPSGITSIRATLDQGTHLVGTIGLVVKPGALSYGRFVPSAR
jgi:hypothetical protein